MQLKDNYLLRVQSLYKCRWVKHIYSQLNLLKMKSFQITFSGASYLLPLTIEIITNRLLECDINFSIENKGVTQLATISSNNEISLSDSCLIGFIIANEINKYS